MTAACVAVVGRVEATTWRQATGAFSSVALGLRLGFLFCRSAAAAGAVLGRSLAWRNEMENHARHQSTISGAEQVADHVDHLNRSRGTTAARPRGAVSCPPGCRGQLAPMRSPSVPHCRASRDHAGAGASAQPPVPIRVAFPDRRQATAPRHRVYRASPMTAVPAQRPPARSRRSIAAGQPDRPRSLRRRAERRLLKHSTALRGRRQEGHQRRRRRSTRGVLPGLGQLAAKVEAGGESARRRPRAQRAAWLLACGLRSSTRAGGRQSNGAERGQRRKRAADRGLRAREAAELRGRQGMRQQRDREGPTGRSRASRLALARAPGRLLGRGAFGALRCCLGQGAARRRREQRSCGCSIVAEGALRAPPASVQRAAAQGAA